MLNETKMATVGILQTCHLANSIGHFPNVVDWGKDWITLCSGEEEEEERKRRKRRKCSSSSVGSKVK